MFKKVMVVIDLQADHQFALEKSLQLARSDEFELVLFSCEHDQYLTDGYYFDAADVERLRAAAIEERMTALEEIADPLRANGLDVTTVAEWAYPNYEGVIDQAEKQNVDLVIYHIEHRDSMSRLMLTYDDWQIIRLCPTPLMLVKNTPWKQCPTIMAAVDPQHGRHKPSGLDHKLLDVCEHLGELMGGEVFAVHAFRPVPLSGTYPIEVKKEHEESFRKLMSEFNVAEDHQLLIEDIPPVALREAEQQLDTDIIAMGAISRSLVSDVIIGSTTQEVLGFLNCDILVLKPDA